MPGIKDLSENSRNELTLLVSATEAKLKEIFGGSHVEFAIVLHSQHKDSEPCGGAGCIGNLDTPVDMVNLLELGYGALVEVCNVMHRQGQDPRQPLNQGDTVVADGNGVTVQQNRKH